MIPVKKFLTLCIVKELLQVIICVNLIHEILLNDCFEISIHYNSEAHVIDKKD